MQVVDPPTVVTDTRVNDDGSLKREVIVDAAPGANKGYLAELAFMEEMIDIELAESTDPNVENPVQVGCNGTHVFVSRGVPTRLKRKFANALIVRSTNISTPEYLNPAGERATAIKQHHSMKFPFTVLHDPNPRGRDWLRNRMLELA